MELDATVAISGHANDLLLDGNLLYCADRYGLCVLDVTDPQNILTRGHWGSTGLSEGITVSGTTGYLSDGVDGLHILDLTNPDEPVGIGSVDDVDQSFLTLVAGGYLYVSAGEDGLVILDNTNPEDPYEIGSYDPDGWVHFMDVNDDMIALAAGTQGIVLLDSAIPSSPQYISEIALPGTAVRVVLDDDYLIALQSEYGISVWNITTPASPVQLTSEPTGGWSTDMIREGDYLYVCDWFNGVSIFDITTPNHPNLTAYFMPDGFTEAISIQDNMLALAVGDEGVELWDVTTVTAPERINTDDPKGSSLDVVTTQDALIYEAAGDIGLRVWNYDLNPAEPLATVDTPGWANALAFSDHYLYLSDGFEGLKILTRGSNPGIEWSIPTVDYAGSVTTTWTTVWDIYVSQGASGFLGLSHEEFNDPIVHGLTPTAGFVYDISAAGNILLTCEGADGFEIFNVSDPAAPAFLSNTQPTGGAWAGVNVGASVYIGTGNNVEVYDITTPQSPVLSATIEDIGWAQKIDILGSQKLAVSCGVDGVYIIDYSQTSPVIWDHANTSGIALGAAGFVSSLILADEMALEAYNLPNGVNHQTMLQPLTYSLQGPYPNPFNPSTNIAFTLNRAERVELAIYDLMGRQITSLCNGSLLPGEHRLSWHPDPAVSSGTYFVTLKVGNNKDVRQLIYLK